MNEPDVFLPTINPDRCGGCGECVQVCPTGALVLVNGCAVLVSPDRCGYCADCEEYCPHGAISLPYEIVADSETPRPALPNAPFGFTISYHPTEEF